MTPSQILPGQTYVGGKRMVARTVVTVSYYTVWYRTEVGKRYVRMDTDKFAKWATRQAEAAR